MRRLPLTPGKYRDPQRAGQMRRADPAGKDNMHNYQCFETIEWLGLRLFDGEGAGAAAGNDGASADAQDAEFAGEEEAQNDSFATTPETETAESRYANFMSDPEMKKLHEKQFQREIGRRLKGQAAMQRELEEARPVLDLMRSVHGVGSNKELYEKLKNDEQIISEEAAKLGMSNEGYVKYRDAMVRLDAEDAAKQQALMIQYDEALDRELDELTKIYPGADPYELRQNEEFMSMMRLPHISARHAYEVLHADELFANVAREGVRQGKQKAAEALRSRQNRPAENAMGSRGAGNVKPLDISKLTPAEMDELERRALRGERVGF